MSAVKKIIPAHTSGGFESATVLEAKAMARFKWTEDHDLAFPEIDPGQDVVGSRVLVQIRSARSTSKGGIILTGETKDTEQWNTQIGLVRQIGALSYMNRNTMEPWPEGAWCHVGQFVRVPKYGGDRWQVDVSGADPALFVVFKDTEVITRVRVDPLTVKAFI